MFLQQLPLMERSVTLHTLMCPASSVHAQMPFQLLRTTKRFRAQITFVKLETCVFCNNMDLQQAFCLVTVKQKTFCIPFFLTFYLNVKRNFILVKSYILMDDKLSNFIISYLITKTSYLTPQIWQEYGRASLCITMWSFKKQADENSLGQYWHLSFFGLRTILRWTLKVLLLLKILLQCEHFTEPVFAWTPSICI